jgi:hypothetical protein
MPVSASLSGDAWIHDEGDIVSNDNYTMFYGVGPYPSYVEFIVNEASDFTKVFDNIDINTGGEELHEIEYNTSQQHTVHFPFVEGLPSSLWRDPKYDENIWRLPIIRQQAQIPGDNNFYYNDSLIRDKFVIVKLTWKQTKRIYIKSVLTNFRVSKQ